MRQEAKDLREEKERLKIALRNEQRYTRSIIQAYKREETAQKERERRKR